MLQGARPILLIALQNMSIRKGDLQIAENTAKRSDYSDESDESDADAGLSNGRFNTYAVKNRL